VYRGVVDPLDPNTHQIVDNNPGIAPDGLLWTFAAPNGAVHIDLDAGEARYRMNEVRMRDYGTLANALFGRGVGVPGPSVPSTVSWDLRWYGVTGRGTTTDTTIPFRLDHESTNAHLDWSMTSGDRSFTSNPSGQTAVVAFIGEDRNGVFFNSSGSDGDAVDD
jgi:hypothetical protein